MTDIELKAIVERAVKIFNERDKLTDKYLSECLTDNETCARILEYESVQELEKDLGLWSTFKDRGEDIDRYFRACDAMPEVINYYAKIVSDPSAPKTVKKDLEDYIIIAKGKLRLLINNRLPFTDPFDNLK